MPRCCAVGCAGRPAARCCWRRRLPAGLLIYMPSPPTLLRCCCLPAGWHAVLPLQQEQVPLPRHQPRQGGFCATPRTPARRMCHGCLVSSRDTTPPASQPASGQLCCRLRSLLSWHGRHSTAARAQQLQGGGQRRQGQPLLAAEQCGGRPLCQQCRQGLGAGELQGGRRGLVQHSRHTWAAAGGTAEEASCGELGR